MALSMLTPVTPAAAALAAGRGAASAALRTWLVPGQVATIKAAVDSARAGDTVLVACGTYLEHGIVMKSGVELRSATGDPACATIDAEGLGRVFYCSGCGPDTRVSGFTITGGSFRDGAGMYCTLQTMMTVSKCVFRKNAAEFGAGAVCVLGSSAVFEDCTFVDNHATRDGGGAGASNSSPVFRRCTFVANVAGRHGSALLAQNFAKARLEWSLVALNSDPAPFDPPWSNALISTEADCPVQVSCCDLCTERPLSAAFVSPGVGVDGNIAVDPQFCAADPAGATEWTLQSDSPCAPANSACGLIGAWPVGCGVVEAERQSWGGVRALYR